MKKGEVFDLGAEPALVESPGQISVLLLPPADCSGGRDLHNAGDGDGHYDRDRARG